VSRSDEKLRADAMACLLAAIEAVEPSALVSDRLAKISLGRRPVHLAGIGKAAGTMAMGAHALLGKRLSGGALIVPDLVEAPSIPGVEVFRGGHPTPTEEGVRGAEAILRMADGLGKDDVLLCLISGGGSALMTLPPHGVTLADVRATTDLLLRAGATIQELNCVRKHLDRLKGGRLARIAAPSRVVGLVLSDVCGDPLDVIASGPLSPDPTTYETAVHVLTTRRLWSSVPDSVRRHLTAGLEGDIEETPAEDDLVFRNVDVQVVGSNRLAAAAARREAERLGYRTRLLTTELTGEAREAGRFLAAVGREMRRSGEPVGPPGCVVAAGETTVTVRGDGKGGRNQELALGAAVELRGTSGLVVGSVGTDGIDGPTDAAGALVDGTTVHKAMELGLDPADVLARNDAYTLLKAVDQLIVTGPTGTNVMDIQVVMAGDS
jgi:glycerate 2-kinase